ncbi:MAG: DUF2304 domain-containing protein [Actinomycetaceae bacterium]|nr:DUF2304 domain-containing protein [Actinomycetaceae bacterium]
MLTHILQMLGSSTTGAQLGIKAVLVTAVILLVVSITRSEGARHMAVRRILTFIFAIAALSAIIFPQALSSLALFLGVGRGTDLVLYGLVIVFFGYLVVDWRRHLATDRQITILTRRLAILEARDHSNAQENVSTKPPSEEKNGETGLP